MRNFFRKSRFIILVLVIGAAVGGWFFLQKGRSNTETTFQTAQVERGNLVATIGATGTVRAKQTAVLLWQTSGTVEVVNVKVGDNVPDGYVMALLEKTSLPQNLILAEADLASAKLALEDLLNSNTALAQAAISLRSAQGVYDVARRDRASLDGLVTIEEVIEREKKTPFGLIKYTEIKKYKGYVDRATIAKSDERLALAKAKLNDAKRTFERLSSGNIVEIAAAQARVDAAQATLNLIRISAPFPGIVTESYPLTGDQVNAGTTAFRLDDLSSMYVDVDVSEVDINNIVVGQPATLAFDAILGRKYEGRVVEVSKVGSVVGGVVTFKVTVEVTNPDDLVKPGMTAAVDITIKELKDVVLIPNRAVRLIDGARYVYVLEDGKPTRKRIRIESSSDQQSAISEGEIKLGDTIILNPPVEFGPGPGGGPGGGFGN
jgi:HlyD family secretion protein